MTDIHLGLAYAAANTWVNPRLRPVSHRVLIGAIPDAAGQFAKAVMEVFNRHGQDEFPTGRFTAELLAAIAVAPKVLVTDHTNLLVDQLKALLRQNYPPAEIGRVARRIVEEAGDAIANIATGLSVSSTGLIDLAITLQQFPDARPDGTWIFEQLLTNNAYPMATVLPQLDRRF